MIAFRTLGYALTLTVGATLTGCDVEYGMSSDGDGVDAPDNVDGQGTTGGENIPDNVETGSVQGRICAPDGESWVEGAIVYVDTEWGRLQTVTDAEGYFKLEGVPVGAQDVEVEKGSFTATVGVLITANEVLQLASDECVGDVDIAVITGTYDNIQSILDRLSIPFDEIAGTWDMYDYGATDLEHVAFLSDPARMADYDIIFFNCGLDDSWSQSPAIVQNIRDYVENGGSVYASDQAYYVLEGPFPDAADFMGDDTDPWSAYVGSMGHVEGTITSKTLESALGKATADINYDLDSWASISATGDAEVLIEGTYPWMDWEDYDSDTNTHRGPLALRYSAGSGVVLYTTFHNEPQLTEDMDNLLREFVLSL